MNEPEAPKSSSEIIMDEVNKSAEYFKNRNELTEQERAERQYPLHHPETALANYRAEKEVWDTNGDVW